MGWIVAALQSGGTAAGEGATAASAAGTAAETAATTATAAQAAAETAPAVASYVPQAAASVPEFNDISSPTPSFIPSESDLGKVSSSALNDFKAQPGFLDNLGEFGKNFGLELSKNIIQSSLRQVPGGRTIGTVLSRSFDSPTLKSLFADPNDELVKRDDIIQLLLKQRLGKA